MTAKTSGSPVAGQNASWISVQPVEGSAVLCSHCQSIAFRILGDNIIVIHRHHGQYHKTVAPLSQYGFVKQG